MMDFAHEARMDMVGRAWESERVAILGQVCLDIENGSSEAQCLARSSGSGILRERLLVVSLGRA